MKLYVKQNIFAIKDRYYIYDEEGNKKYYVEGKLISIGNKLTLFDNKGNELYKIKEKVLTILPKYYILKDDEIIVEINKRFTLLKDKYNIEQLGWEVFGSILNHDYSIKKGSKVIATVHKKWITIGDCYEFDIADSEYIELVLAVIIVIDQVLEQRQTNNN